MAGVARLTSSTLGSNSTSRTKPCLGERPAGLPVHRQSTSLIFSSIAGIPSSSPKHRLPKLGMERARRCFSTMAELGRGVSSVRSRVGRLATVGRSAERTNGAVTGALWIERALQLPTAVAALGEAEGIRTSSRCFAFLSRVPLPKLSRTRGFHISLAFCLPLWLP